MVHVEDRGELVVRAQTCCEFRQLKQVSAIRVTAPRVKIKVGSWKLELLADISEGTARILCHCLFLAFLQRCLGHGCQDLGLLTSNFDLCTGAP